MLSDSETQSDVLSAVGGTFRRISLRTSAPYSQSQVTSGEVLRRKSDAMPPSPGRVGSLRGPRCLSNAPLPVPHSGTSRLRRDLVHVDQPVDVEPPSRQVASAVFLEGPPDM